MHNKISATASNIPHVSSSQPFHGANSALSMRINNSCSRPSSNPDNVNGSGCIPPPTSAASASRCADNNNNNVILPASMVVWLAAPSNHQTLMQVPGMNGYAELTFWYDRNGTFHHYVCKPYYGRVRKDQKWIQRRLHFLGNASLIHDNLNEVQVNSPFNAPNNPSAFRSPSSTPFRKQLPTDIRNLKLILRSSESSPMKCSVGGSSGENSSNRQCRNPPG